MTASAGGRATRVVAMRAKAAAAHFGVDPMFSGMRRGDARPALRPPSERRP